jgi:DHA1 family bicyclomycin/chloramphenicol resistance-like MFS transporter
MVPVLAGGCAHGAFFAYLAGSSFVFIELHHVPTAGYSVLFAVNAIAMIGAAQFNVRLVQRFGAGNLMRGAAGVFLLCALLLLSAVLLRIDTVPLMVGLLMVMIGSFGLINPTAAMLALESHGKVAGTASALMGSLQFACGALSSAAISALFNGTAIPMAATMVVCAALALLFAWNAVPGTVSEPEPTLVDPATDSALS